MLSADDHSVPSLNSLPSRDLTADFQTAKEEASQLRTQLEESAAVCAAQKLELAAKDSELSALTSMAMSKVKNIY